MLLFYNAEAMNVNKENNIISKHDSYYAFILPPTFQY